MTVHRVAVEWRDLRGTPYLGMDEPAHPYVRVRLSKDGLGKYVEVPAMIDTGCTHSVFSPAVIRELGLVAKRQIEMAGNWSVTTQSAYDATIQVVGFLDLAVRCEVSDLSIQVDGFQPAALLGFDVVRFGALHLQYGGSSYLEFNAENLAKSC